MRKIITITSIIILCIGGIIIIKNLISKNSIEDSEVLDETEEELEWWIEESKRREEIIKQEYISEEEIYEMAKSSPNWDKIDIVEDKKDILKKNYPNGILLGNEYDDIKLEENYKSLIDPMGGPFEFNILAEKGLKKDKYKVIGTGYGNLFLKTDFEISEIQKFELIDENGIEVNSGIPMDEVHWMSNMQRLALQDDKEVGKSEDFYERYPNFTGILNPYNEAIEDITIKPLLEQCNFKNKEYMCEVYYRNRYIYVTYKINYTIDGNKYIETFETKELSSREYEWNDYNKLLNSTGIAIKVLLKNRDMNKVPFTKKLITSINDGLIDYDIVSFRRIKYEKGQKNNQNLYKIVLTNGEVRFIGLKYKFLNDQIDEIEINELPITEETFKKYTTKELYEMF